MNPQLLRLQAHAYAIKHLGERILVDGTIYVNTLRSLFMAPIKLCTVVNVTVTVAVAQYQTIKVMVEDSIPTRVNDCISIIFISKHKKIQKHSTRNFSKNGEKSGKQKKIKLLF